MSYSVSRRFFAFFLTLVLASFAMAAERAFDRTPRIAIISNGENKIETFFKLAADNSAKVLMAFLAAWK